MREASIEINYCTLQSLTNNTVNKPSRKINFQSQIHWGGEKVMTVTEACFMLTLFRHGRFIRVNLKLRLKYITNSSAY